MSGGPKRRVFVALGSNLGERSRSLSHARERLGALPQTELVGESRVYETAARDLPGQPPFLNQVVCLETGLEPLALLDHCQAIETGNGRERTVRFGPRTLDIDILLFEGVTSDAAELTLPHPRLWERAFVLVPLAEVWDLARDMPAVDVAALAATLAAEQSVEPYDDPEE